MVGTRNISTCPEQRSAQATGPGNPGSPFTVDGRGLRWFRTDDAAGVPGRRPGLRILGRLDCELIINRRREGLAPAARSRPVLHRLPGVSRRAVVPRLAGRRVGANGWPPSLVLAPGAAGAPGLARGCGPGVAADVSGPAAPPPAHCADRAAALRGPGKPDLAAIEKALREQPPLEGNLMADGPRKWVAGARLRTLPLAVAPVAVGNRRRRSGSTVAGGWGIGPGRALAGAGRGAGPLQVGGETMPTTTRTAFGAPTT